jgi:hypothetical protein
MYIPPTTLQTLPIQVLIQIIGLLDYSLYISLSRSSKFFLMLFPPASCKSSVKSAFVFEAEYFI